MENILITSLKFLMECFLNIVTAILPAWGFALFNEKEGEIDVVTNCMWCLSIGLFLGWTSVLAVHKSLIPLPPLRIVSLVISPPVAGWVSQKIARLYRDNTRDKNWPKRQFWYAFCLCLGYVALRFFGVERWYHGGAY